MSFVDGHCDTITTLMEKKENLYGNTCHIDIKRLLKYKAPVQFFAIWFSIKNSGIYLRQTLKAISFYEEQLHTYKEFINKATSTYDIEENQKNNKISAILSIEGGEALEGELAMLDIFYKLGVRMMSLTWNHDNEFGTGAATKDVEAGLTDLGIEAIKKMNQLGMMVDVSHLSEKSFFDVIKTTTKPIVASHSNARTLCNSKRNLTDEQLKAIQKNNGLVGINFYPHFLKTGGNATVDDILLHMDYILNLIGEDYIGLGADFDGIEILPQGVADISVFEIIHKRLQEKYGETIANKIMFENYMNLIKNNLASL